MKKFLIAFLAVAFVFTACQKNVTEVTPVSDSNTSKATTLDPCVTTKIIAGGGSHDDDCSGLWVGNVYVQEEGNTVIVQYVMDGPDAGWWMDQVHLFVGTIEDFEKDCLNKKGSPMLGHFPINETKDPRVQSVTYEITFDGGIPADYIVAAHTTVVDDESLPKASEFDFCAYLPETASIRVGPNLVPGVQSGTGESYLWVRVGNADWLNHAGDNPLWEYIAAGQYNGWCIDPGTPITPFQTFNDVPVFCTYPTIDGSEPCGYSCEADDLIFNRCNWPWINYIINNLDLIIGQESPTFDVNMLQAGDEGYDPNNPYIFNALDVQYIIWYLVDDYDLYEYEFTPAQIELGLAIYATYLGLYSEVPFIPGEGDVIAVAFEPRNEDGSLAQRIIIPVPYISEGAADNTAWGYGQCVDEGGAYCDYVGACHYDEVGVAYGRSFISAFGAKNWGWYFYGCDFVPPVPIP